MKTRGYFFTFDAFLATGIIVLGIVLVNVAYLNRPYEMQTTSLSQDLMQVFSSTQLFELTDNQYLDDMVAASVITNPQYTVLEQLGEFSYLGMNSTATSFVEEVMVPAFPPNYNVEIWIRNNDTLLFQYSQGKDASFTDVLISSKTLVFGLTNHSVMWGPYIAEVHAWQ